MKKMAMSFAIALLAGCTTGRYYLPVEEALRTTGTSCGYPYGGGRLSFGEHASIFISMHPDADVLSITLQVALLENSRVEFLSRDIELTPDGGDPIVVKIPSESNDSATFIARSPYRPYVINLAAHIRDYKRITLRLPPLRVNGEPVDAREVVFEYVEKMGVVSCIQ